MTKRIVSGIFILTALGALGVILAGALTSGEQLIVRFLTAVIVAALGLYVISDLRLQADDDARGTKPVDRNWLNSVEAPPNSTAAFMATVTRHSDAKSGTTQIGLDQDGLAEDGRQDPHEEGVGATSSSTSERTESAVVEDAGSLAGSPPPSLLGSAPVTLRASDLPQLLIDKTIVSSADDSIEFAEDDQSDDAWPSYRPLVSDDHDDHDGDGSPEARVPQHDLDRSTDDTPFGDVDRSFVETSLMDQATGPDHDHDHAAADDDLGPIDHDEPLSDVAVAEFEYSGETEVAHLEWPAAPDDGEHAQRHEDLAADVPSPIRLGFEPDGATMAGASSGVEDDDASAAGPMIDPAEIAAHHVLADLDGPPIGVEATDELDELHRFDAPLAAEVDTSASGPDTDAADAAAAEFESFLELNGTHRPLPSPFVDRSSLQSAEYADAPLAPIIDLRDVATTTGSSIETAIQAGEVEVISALISQGMLSVAGPISDRDVRTMVYVAFTSNELRKLLLAGGNPEHPAPEVDLGPVELFSRGLSAPKTLYPGPPVQTEARSQLG